MVVRRPARSRRSLAASVPGTPAFPRVTGFVVDDERRFPARPFASSSEHLPSDHSVLEFLHVVRFEEALEPVALVGQSG